MKRPGVVGMTIVLAFAIVVAVEFRTLLGMFGFEFSAQLYYGAAAVIVATVLVGLLTLPKNETTGAQST